MMLSRRCTASITILTIFVPITFFVYFPCSKKKNAKIFDLAALSISILYNVYKLLSTTCVSRTGSTITLFSPNVWSFLNAHVHEYILPRASLGVPSGAYVSTHISITYMVFVQHYCPYYSCKLWPYCFRTKTVDRKFFWIKLDFYVKYLFTLLSNENC